MTTNEKPIELWSENELAELAVPEHSPRYLPGIGFRPPEIGYDMEPSTQLAIVVSVAV